MSYRIEQPLPAWRRIDYPSVAGFAMASAGLIALIVEVKRPWAGGGSPPRGWTCSPYSGCSACPGGSPGGLSKVPRAGGGHWPLLGVVVSGIGVALLLILAVIWFVSEHPDILTDDSKKKRKGSRNKRRRGRSSW